MLVRVSRDVYNSLVLAGLVLLLLFYVDLLYAQEELCHVEYDSPGEWVSVLACPLTLQVAVALVVEHLVRRQIHRSVEQLAKQARTKCG